MGIASRCHWHKIREKVTLNKALDRSDPRRDYTHQLRRSSGYGFDDWMKTWFEYRRAEGLCLAVKPHTGFVLLTVL
jgi:hypothetical protein